MEQTASLDLPAEDAARIQAQMQEDIREMERANERIERHYQEIDRLRRKTRATLAELAEMKII